MTVFTLTLDQVREMGRFAYVRLEEPAVWWVYTSETDLLYMLEAFKSAARGADGAAPNEGWRHLEDCDCAICVNPTLPSWLHD